MRLALIVDVLVCGDNWKVRVRRRGQWSFAFLEQSQTVPPQQLRDSVMLPHLSLPSLLRFALLAFFSLRLNEAALVAYQRLLRLTAAVSNDVFIHIVQLAHLEGLVDKFLSCFWICDAVNFLFRASGILHHVNITTV